MDQRRSVPSNGPTVPRKFPSWVRSVSPDGQRRFVGRGTGIGDSPLGAVLLQWTCAGPLGETLRTNEGNFLGNRWSYDQWTCAGPLGETLRTKEGNFLGNR